MKAWSERERKLIKNSSVWTLQQSGFKLIEFVQDCASHCVNHNKWTKIWCEIKPWNFHLVNYTEQVNQDFEKFFDAEGNHWKSLSLI